MIARLVLVPFLLLIGTLLVPDTGQAQVFGTPVNVSKTRANSGNGLMAVSVPNVHVAWTDSGKPFYSRSTDSGTTFSKGVQIFSNSATTAILDMAASGSTVYVARGSGGNTQHPSQVYVRRSTNGASFDAEIQLSDASSTTQLSGIAAAAGTVYGDLVHVVWIQWTGHWQVFYRRSVNNGASYEPPIQLSATAGNDTLSNVQLIADGTTVHVAWADYLDDGTRAIYYARSTDGGGTFGRREVSDRSNPATTTNVIPYLAASGASVFLVWRAHATVDLTPYVYFASSIDTGGTFSPPALLPGAPSGPVLQAAVSGNDVHVIWDANSGVNNDVFYMRSHDNGGTWSAATTISDVYGAVGVSPDPVIAANASDVYIAWKGGASPAFEIYMRHSGNGGDSFTSLLTSPVVNVSQTPNANSENPSTIAAPGKVHVLWEDSSPGNSDIFYRQGTP